MATDKEFLRQALLTVVIFIGGMSAPEVFRVMRSEASTDVRMEHVESELVDLRAEAGTGARWTATDQREYSKDQARIHGELIKMYYEHAADCDGNWKLVMATLSSLDERLKRKGI